MEKKNQETIVLSKDLQIAFLVGRLHSAIWEISSPLEREVQFLELAKVRIDFDFPHSIELKPKT